ncbi:purine-nucleoside phosphorylase [Lactococcus raffinolactis]|nr:purine-nucleoside phosphorylase [Lactococcus raffinolactis]MDT2765538.1 purine-nucleoside phosphorylase [Lactococcus raffinolactis]MDT2788312.1 purine-nucleoside phosphorylase [Lactococcus raffinolactis]
MMTIMDKIKETVVFLQEQGVKEVDFGLILGSGLGELADEISNPVVIDYADIPNWGKSTVAGHAGKLVYGTLSGKKVLALQGRFHFYEGNPLDVVTFPVRVMAELDATGIVVTNAAGGVTHGPGTLMLINDHINFTGQNPLIGENLDAYGPRFPDMSSAYDKAYQATAKVVADRVGIDLQEGVYMGFTGPTYETPAEIRFAETIGADAVGMSTVPEVIIAVHSGLRVLGISAITNHAAGKQAELNHEEVVEVTTRIKETFKTLIKEILEEL